MKNTVTFFCALVLFFAFVPAFAQTTGAITYETKFNMHRNLPEEKAEMKKVMPEYNTTRQILTFNATESLYKPLIDEQDDVAAASEGGPHMIMRMVQEQTYLNTALNKCVVQREIMGKYYLIPDSLTVLPWKLSDETKMIAGYLCKKATYTDTKKGKTTIAWYTPALRAGLGPDRFTSLPGAVLEIDFDNGLRIIKATKIDLRPLKKNDLQEPTKGERVTAQKFQEIMEEHRKMRRAGSGGGVIIRN